MKLRQVRVTEWGPNDASRPCLELVLTDPTEIDDALKRTPWTSKGLLKSIATKFRDCVVTSGGKAELL